ncbi:hypothetical protein Bpfe_029429 [Biomphalaria pfeifferi]|uniref:Uncharacterized protein n=1 Tax=Biomphalaria pfeifferi TaxID=112525 RepID=A0AAD8ARN0_BIOPF|nr:hypothetical protein Bpfe_029429 [Biomphalaria pfeifferi]
MSLSVSSIRRSRSKHRTQAAADVKSAFNRDGPLVIHFDGKLLPSIAGGPGKEDRVAIIPRSRQEWHLVYNCQRTGNIFKKVLNLDKSLLNLSVEQWSQLEAYQHAKVVAHSLKVVNDSAERGIALATNFNKSLTKKENEMQYLYQVVESHRKRTQMQRRQHSNQLMNNEQCCSVLCYLTGSVCNAFIF